MNFFVFVLMIVNMIIPNSDSSSVVWVGEKFPGYRVIVTNIVNDNILVEVGGTSLKMGGDILLLKRKSQNNNVIYAKSDSTKSYIEKRCEKYYFIYNGKLGKRTYKLKKKKYSAKIERIRLRIFRSYYYDFFEKSPKLLKSNFDLFIKNPVNFFKNHTLDNR